MLTRFSLAAALVSSALAGDADRDFSGRWTLNPERSTLHSLPAAPAGSLDIEQTGGQLKCAEGALTWSATFDGKSTKSKSGGRTVNVALKWEGAALLVDALVSAPGGDYAQMDRWKLSRDGSTLTVRREVVGRIGSVEATLVYERPELAAAAAPAAAPEPAPPRRYVVPAGTHIPLTMVNGVSAKYSTEGDRVYLTTAFPILADGRVVIPPGSHVAGTLTRVKRPGRAAGRGELYLRFDSLTLPNGVTRDFRARLGGLDGDTRGRLDRDEGKIEGDGAKGGDARTVGEATAAGASVGTIAGRAAGHTGMGAGVGAAAGAAAGLAGVLLSRGPDIVLAKGATVEMQLDRPLVFEETELPARR
jgi:hypothetical protein